MKLLQIVPRDGRRFYDAIVRKQDDIRKNGRGTFSRRGRKRTQRGPLGAREIHGSVDLERVANLVTAKVKSRGKVDESEPVHGPFLDGSIAISARLAR